MRPSFQATRRSLMFAIRGLPGGLYHPNICWMDNTARQKQSRKFLECIDDNFLAQMFEELMRVDAVLDLELTKREGQVRDVNAGGSLGCSDHQMVEFRILMEKTRQKARPQP